MCISSSAIKYLNKARALLLQALFDLLCSCEKSKILLILLTDHVLFEVVPVTFVDFQSSPPADPQSASAGHSGVV